MFEHTPHRLFVARLVENEIGGVINGSLNAAKKKRPLNEAEYLEEIRSNIPNKNDEGIAKRKVVYGEFVQYGQWKKENARFDLGDIVLELLALGGKIKCQEFVSAYLDEVSTRSGVKFCLVNVATEPICVSPSLSGARFYLCDHFLDMQHRWETARALGCSR